MTNEAITQLVAIGAAIVGVAAFVGLVTVPAVAAFERVWERVVAGLLSLWVLAALVGVGVLAGGAIIVLWPRLF